MFLWSIYNKYLNHTLGLTLPTPSLVSIYIYILSSVQAVRPLDLDNGGTKDFILKVQGDGGHFIEVSIATS